MFHLSFFFFWSNPLYISIVFAIIVIIITAIIAIIVISIIMIISDCWLMSLLKGGISSPYVSTIDPTGTLNQLVCDAQFLAI